MNDTVVDITRRRLDTGIIGATEEDAIMISYRALEKIKNIRVENSIPEDYSLRLGAQSGGCSGMNYLLGFDADINDYDKLLEIENLSIVVDRSSLFYLMGVTLDYINDENGSGFVFNNPNNVKSCGCGGGGH